MLRHHRAAARGLPRDRAHPARSRTGAAARLAADAARPRAHARRDRHARRRRARVPGRSRARSSTRRAARSRSTTSPPTSRSGATPVRGTYRGLEIVSMPPPSSGGVILIEMLNALEPHDVASLGLNSSEMVNLVAGAMKLAFADRAEYLGDPDFSTVPTDYLVSRAYGDRARGAPAARRRSGCARRGRWGEARDPERRGARRSRRRTTTARHRSRSSTRRATPSRSRRRSTRSSARCITVPGTGIVLNNEMDDFSLPGTPNAWGAVGQGANAIQPGKRPLSSMTPTIVLENGQVRYVVGSPMGTFIITAVLQSLLNSVDFKLGPSRRCRAALPPPVEPAPLELAPTDVQELPRRAQSMVRARRRDRPAATVRRDSAHAASRRPTTGSRVRSRRSYSALEACVARSIAVEVKSFGVRARAAARGARAVASPARARCQRATSTAKPDEPEATRRRGPRSRAQEPPPGMSRDRVRGDHLLEVAGDGRSDLHRLATTGASSRMTRFATRFTSSTWIAAMRSS